MKKFTFGALAAIAFVMGGFAVSTIINPPTAEAQSNAKAVVDKAISEGKIGETIGGYLAVVSSVSESERRAMNEINISRKSVYTGLAQKRGVSVDVVAKLIGEKQLAKAPAGSKIMNESGRWSTK